MTVRWSDEQLRAESARIASLPCRCTEDDSCWDHEALDLIDEAQRGQAQQ